MRIDADRTEAVRHHAPNSQASQVIPRQAIQALLTQIPSKCGAVIMVQWPRRVPAGFTVATTCSGRFYSGHDVFRPVLQWPRRVPAGFTVATTCSGRFYSGHDVFRPVLQWPRRDPVGFTAATTKAIVYNMSERLQNRMSE